VLEPLPSYGRGRDAPAGRFTSLIFGTNLTDVIVTGKKAKKPVLCRCMYLFITVWKLIPSDDKVHTCFNSRCLCTYILHTSL